MNQKILNLVFLISISIASCISNPSGLNVQLHSYEVYRLLASDNSDLTWLDSSTLIIKEFNSQTEIWSLDIFKKDLHPILISTNCQRFFVRSLQRLPDQNAGFILDCPSTKSQRIQYVNLDQKQSADIYVEPLIAWLGQFSFSKDMKELALVDINGVGLESTLFYQNSNGVRKNITPDFHRADFPVWSPKENVIAFLGTKLTSNNTDNSKTWSEIENLFDYPWKVYLYHIDNGLIDELPVEIVHPGRFKWSPNGQWLGFTGRYNGIPGVWIIDLENGYTVIRVADQIASFDFSPDGKSIACIIDSSEEGYDQIRIIELNID